MHKVGTVIFKIGANGEEIRREIIAVRPTGYTWRYPDIPDQTFDSENSNDPLFEWDWKAAE
jgi:hypothetical protein